MSKVENWHPSKYRPIAPTGPTKANILQEHGSSAYPDKRYQIPSEYDLRRLAAEDRVMISFINKEDVWLTVDRVVWGDEDENDLESMVIYARVEVPSRRLENPPLQQHQRVILQPDDVLEIEFADEDDDDDGDSEDD